MKTQQLFSVAALACILISSRNLAAQSNSKIDTPQKRQERTQDDLMKLRDKKLAKPFIKFGNWMTDYDFARARAKKEGKVLFVYFTASYFT